MRAEILSIGTEILLGHITDTNAPYLARFLAELGIDLFHISQVGDNEQRVTETLRHAWDRADVIIMTGGLGPTEDDVSREAIIALLDEQPVVNTDYLEQLRSFFGSRGVVMPESNVKQAWLIPSAQPLANPIGTAPGWYVERDGHIIIAMPGVPREMYRMWEEQALPRLRPLSGQTLFTRILRVTGLGESTVEERLGDMIHWTNPTLATYAKVDAVDVRISAKAVTQAEAETILAPAETEARALLGKHVFGAGTQTLAQVVGGLLTARSWQLGVLESCTGGLFANLITDRPGSSAYMRGGIVTYATDIKVMMGVSQATIDTSGVISDETALAMAHAARERLAADVGVGITGVAGPDEQDGHPVGEVHLAVSSPLGETVRTVRLPGDRADVKRRAAFAALDLLRLHLQEEL